MHRENNFLLLICLLLAGLVTYTTNPSILKAEAGGLLWDPGQAVLPSELKDNLNYLARPCLKKPKSKQTNQKFCRATQEETSLPWSFGSLCHFQWHLFLLSHCRRNFPICSYWLEYLPFIHSERRRKAFFRACLSASHIIPLSMKKCQMLL